jgi:PPOX class probable F420-dependent enzyme
LPLLDETECWGRVERARHGVLATVHLDRGVDAVPVVYAVVDRRLVLPVDTVKPKRHLRLGRLANLAQDPRCVLLVEHYADDWSELWWVRIHAAASTPVASQPGPAPSWLDALAARYPHYGEPGAVAAAVVLQPTAVTGWAARGGPGSGAGPEGVDGVDGVDGDGGDVR